MGQGYESLANEIDRIVKSPYPTQLKTLHSITLSNSKPADLIRWATSNPCMVDTLASRVLEAVARWSYVLDIITCFCIDIRLRNSFLRQKPHLLPDLVRKAADAQHIQSAPVRAATALLSHPLPPDVPLPADAQMLFIRLFSEAAAKPVTATLKSAYTILSNSPTELLDLLTEESLAESEDHFDAILREDKSETQCQKLYCLAIGHCLMTAFDKKDKRRLSASSFETQGLLSSPTEGLTTWRPDIFRKLFCDQKGARTLQLLTFRAYNACRQVEGQPSDDSLDCLQLVNRIVLAIPKPQRHQCAATEPISTFVAKILGKVQDESVPFPCRTAALTFVGRLFDLDQHLPEIRNCVELITLSPEFLSQTESPIDTTYFLGTFDAVLDADLISRMLMNVIDRLRKFKLDHAITSWELDACIQIIHKLEHLSDTNPDIVEGVAMMLQERQIEGKLRAIVKTLEVQSPSRLSSQPVFCFTAQLAHFACVSKAAASLCLRHAFRASSQTNSAVVDVLLEMLTCSAQVPATCSHGREQPSGSQSPLLVQHSEATWTEGSDWRDQITNHLKQKNEADSRTLVEIFARACHDLETRCETVEAPLQHERERSERLQVQNDELITDIERLEKDKVDLAIACHAMEKEASQHMQDLSEAQETTADLHQAIKQLEDKQSALQRATSKQLDELKAHYEKLLLEQQSVLAEMQQQNEELAEQHQTLSDRLEKSIAKSTDVRAQLNAALQSDIEQKSVCDNLRAALDDEQSIVKEVKDKLRHLAADKSQLEAELGAAKQESYDQKFHHAQHVSTLQEAAAGDKERAREVHEREIGDIRSSYEDKVEQLTERLATIQLESDHDRQVFGVELKRRDHRIEDQQQKIAYLTRKCERQTQQIAQAEANHTNFRAHLEGLMQAASNAQPNTVVMPEEAHETEEPSPPTPQPSEADEGEPTEVLVKGSFGSHSSSTSRSGPTPKRPRSRKSEGPRANPLEGASTTTGSRRVSLRSARASVPASVKSRRQPLATLSANKSPLKDSRKSTRAKSPMKHLPDLEYSEFDGNDIFTDTQIEFGHRLARPSRDDASESEL